jgi:hypothetical protein
MHHAWCTCQSSMSTALNQASCQRMSRDPAAAKNGSAQLSSAILTLRDGHKLVHQEQGSTSQKMPDSHSTMFPDYATDLSQGRVFGCKTNPSISTVQRGRKSGREDCKVPCFGHLVKKKRGRRSKRRQLPKSSLGEKGANVSIRI